MGECLFNQRPAAGRFDRSGAVSAAASITGPFGRGCNQYAQTGKAVRRDDAPGDKFCQGLFELSP